MFRVIRRSNVMHNQCFRPRERLRSREDFARVFAARCSAGDDIMVVYAAPNELGWTRIGISTSRRVGNAVVRNFIRRRIREAFRRNKDNLPAGFDLVCIPRAKAKVKGVDVASPLLRLSQQAASRCRKRADKS
jgi:ribonuclease P protein component